MEIREIVAQMRHATYTMCMTREETQAYRDAARALKDLCLEYVKEYERTHSEEPNNVQ